jgi:hypothetical protein
MSNVDDIRNAIAGADRAFVAIEGGRGKGAPPPPDKDGVKPCPVTMLGHFNGTFYFLDAIGQRRDLAARGLGNKQELIALFGGKDDWLRSKFPKYAPKPKPTDEVPEPPDVVIDFLVNKTAQYLMHACFCAGMFGDHLVIRKPGVWPDSSGIPVVHCGDAVRMHGNWTDAGCRSEGPRGKTLIWAAASACPRPGTQCEGAIGAKLQDDIQQLFRFRNPGGAIVALGVLGSSYYGAAARWRPSVFFTGQAGCGKSTLIEVLRAASPMHSFSNDTSKAGLTGAIDGRAMLCIIDENEKSDDTAGRAAKTLMDLVLTASGGEGTQGLRANVDGSVRHIEMVGAFAMAATAVPEMRDTHMGRICVVDMEPPAEGEDFRDQHAALIEETRKWGDALWSRALGAWERYGASLAAFRQALKDRGCNPREMDQYGAILAGWWVLTREGMPGEKGAGEGVAALTGFVRTAAMVQETSNAKRLVQYFMTYAIQLDRSSARESIGSLIDRVHRQGMFVMGAKPEDAEFDTEGGSIVAARALATHGVRVIRATDKQDVRGRAVPRLGPQGIWVNANATELRRIFDNSDWAGGRWVTGLLELRGARRSPSPLKVGSINCRAIWISLDELDMQDVEFSEHPPPD